MSGPIRIAITANGRQARAEIQKTGAVAGVMGKQFSKAGKVIAGAFAVSTIARGTAAFVRTGAEYTKELANIQALSNSQVDITGKVAKTLEASRGQYAKYGLTVADAASGVTELVKAGQAIPAALKEVNGTLVLARAGGLDVGDAAELVSNELNAFKLKGGQAMDVANQLANAANLSSANVSDLGESFKYVSVVAVHAGLSFAQTSAMLAFLSNNGLMGSLAGTGLRKVIQSLEAPTGGAADILAKLGVSAYTADGKAKPFRQTLKELNAALAPLSDGERKMDLRKLFGLTGLEAANIILGNTGKSLTKMNDGVKRSGAATKLAEANSAGLMGTLKQLKAEFIDNADIVYRKWSPVMNDAIKPLVPVVHDLGKDFAEVGSIINGIPGPLKSVAVEAGVAALVFPRLAVGVATGTKAIQDQITYLRVLKLEMAETSGRTAIVSAATTKLASAAKTAAGVGGMVLLAQGAGKANTAMGALETTAGAAATGFAVGGPWGAAIGGAAGLAFSLYKKVTQSNHALDAVQKATADAKAGYDSIKASLDQVTGAYTRNTAEALANQLQTTDSGKKFVAAMGKYGIGAREIGKALMGNKSAATEVGRAVQAATKDILPAYQKIADLKTELSDVTPLASRGVPGMEARRQAIQEQIDAQQKLIDQQEPLRQFYLSEGQQLRTQTAEVQKATAARLQLAGLPTNLAVNIATTGGERTLGQVKSIAAVYQGLTAKDYRILLRAEGLAPTKQNLAAVAAAAKTLLPFKQMRIALATPGIDMSKKQIDAYARKIKATPTQIRTLYKLEGIKDVTRGLNDASHTAKDAGRKTGDAVTSGTAEGINKGKGKGRVALSALVSSIASGAAGSAHTKGGSVGTAMSGGFAATVGSGDAPGRFAALVSRTYAAGMAAADAHSPSRKTKKLGQWMGDGLVIGLNNREVRVTAQGAALARAAISGATSAGVPATALGRRVADNYVDGFAGRVKAPKNHKKAKNAVDGFLRMIQNEVALGSSGVDKAVDALSKKITKTLENRIKANSAHLSATRTQLHAAINGPGSSKAYNAAIDKAKAGNAATEKALKAQEKQYLKLLKKHAKKLREIGRREDAIMSGSNPDGTGPSSAAGFSKQLIAQMAAVSKLTGSQINNLKDARSALKDYKQSAVDYANGIRDAIVATGDVTTLGINQMTGGVGLSVLISDMKAKVDQAKKFKADITTLTAAGLNKTSLQQLIAAGPDALASADAIVAGGKAAVTQINSLTAELVGTGTTLGNDASKTFYTAGINAAQGLVDGLTAKKDAVAAVGKKLAKALVAEVKKELKIKSPSRVFKQIGAYSVDGLDQGFDATRIQRIGATSAQALQKSFGEPTLSAYMKDVGTQSTGPSLPPIIIQPSMQQLSALWRGQMIQADLDAARTAGVRQAS